MLLLLCSTSMVVETKLHVMAHVPNLTFVFRMIFETVCVTTLKNDENYGLC